MAERPDCEACEGDGYVGATQFAVSTKTPTIVPGPQSERPRVTPGVRTCAACGGSGLAPREAS